MPLYDGGLDPYWTTLERFECIKPLSAQRNRYCSFRRIEKLRGKFFRTIAYACPQSF